MYSLQQSITLIIHPANFGFDNMSIIVLVGLDIKILLLSCQIVFVPKMLTYIQMS